MVSSRRVKNEIYAYNQYLNCGEHSFLSLLQCSIYVMKRKLRQWWPKFTSILTERTTNFYLNHGTLMKIQILVWEKSKGYCFALGYYYVYLLVQLSLFENNCEYTNSTIHFLAHLSESGSGVRLSVYLSLTFHIFDIFFRTTTYLVIKLTTEEVLYVSRFEIQRGRHDLCLSETFSTSNPQSTICEDIGCKQFTFILFCTSVITFQSYFWSKMVGLVSVGLKHFQPLFQNGFTWNHKTCQKYSSKVNGELSRKFLAIWNPR